jgi:hypothetical protein
VLLLFIIVDLRICSQERRHFNTHDFYPKNFNHPFSPKPDLERYRNNSKKKFEENQNFIDEEFHQDLDHPSTFMKMVKERTRTMLAVNDERRQVLPSKVI